MWNLVSMAFFRAIIKIHQWKWINEKSQIILWKVDLITHFVFNFVFICKIKLLIGWRNIHQGGIISSATCMKSFWTMNGEKKHILWLSCCYLTTLIFAWLYKFWGMSITLLHICLTCYLNVVAWLNFKQRKLFCQAEQLPYLQEKKNHEIRGERWWVYWALTSSAPLLHSKINILMDISYIWGLGWLV